MDGDYLPNLLGSATLDAIQDDRNEEEGAPFLFEIEIRLYHRFRIAANYRIQALPGGKWVSVNIHVAKFVCI